MIIWKRIFKWERNRNGKEYDSDDKIDFEGEYLTGKRWNGKGYNPNNEIEFEITKWKSKRILF